MTGIINSPSGNEDRVVHTQPTDGVVDHGPDVQVDFLFGSLRRVHSHGRTFVILTGEEDEHRGNETQQSRQKPRGAVSRVFEAKRRPMFRRGDHKEAQAGKEERQHVP